MKKILVVLSVLTVLFGAVGCSKKTYKSEDYEVYKLIQQLEELKEDINSNEGVSMNYEVKEDMKGLYTISLTFLANDHKLEMTSPKLDPNNGENISEMTMEDWSYKIDDVSYDWDTTNVLADHYFSSSSFR